MSDSSSVQLYYLEESVWGTTPASALRELRFTSESLSQNTETAVSEEIRADRMVSDIIRTSVNAGGDVGIELSYGAHDDLIAGAMANVWSTALNLNGSFTFTINSPNTSGTISAGSTSPGLSPSPFTNVQVGAWVKFKHTGGTTNDGYYLVTAKPDNDTLTVSPAPASASTVTGRLKGSHIRNGIVRKSFTLEKFYSDLSPAQYQAFTGMRVGTMELSVAPGSIVNGQFGFSGRQSTSSGVTVGTGAAVASSTNDVMNAVDNIGNIRIDGLAPSAGVYFTEISLNLNNSPRNQPAIGSLPNVGIGLGRTQISGTIASYFQNRTLLDRYLNFTALSLSFTATDGAGNSYLYHFPSVKFTAGQAVAGGNDQDVLVNLEFTCRRDPVRGFMFGLNRFPA
jgi:hypothetical protein